MTRRMTRRAFARDLAFLIGNAGLLCLPVMAYAPQPALPRRIGVLLVGFALESKEAQAFRQGLRDAGYTEGRDVVIEWRSALGDFDRLPQLAADLAHRKLDATVVDSTAGTQVLRRATSTIPIIITIVADPVGSGLVASLAHPGGNVTGLSVMSSELWTKRLQLLKDTIPRLTRVAVLSHPDVPWQPKAIANLKAAAPSLSIQLSFVSVRTPEDFGPAFADVSRARTQALYVLSGAQLFVHRRTLLKLVSRAGLPAIYADKRWANEGGLMSYGANYADHWRRSAGYVDKILKGAKRCDLPIEQPTKFELVVNLKTAKALGITIPESILLRADEVIR